MVERLGASSHEPARGTKSHRTWVQQETLRELRVKSARVDTTYSLLCSGDHPVRGYEPVDTTRCTAGPGTVDVVELDTLVCAQRLAAATESTTP